MAVYTIKRYVRPIEDVSEHVFERARGRGNPTGNPFEHTDYELVRKAFDSLTSLDRDEWAAAFMEIARPFEVLLEYARRVPRTRITVLCGHTHGRGEYRACDNLLVRTGGWAPAKVWHSRAL